MAAKKFTGELAEPLKPMFLGGLLSTGAFGAEDLGARMESERGKLRMVAKHYGVEHPDLNTQTRYVALALAREFVPGFKVADPNKSDGRPQVWTELREGFLIVEMEKEIRRGNKCSVSVAASKLSKRTPWKQICQLAGTNNAAETLRKRYYRARKTNCWQAILRNSLAYVERVNQPDDGAYANVLNSLHNQIPKTSYA